MLANKIQQTGEPRLRSRMIVTCSVLMHLLEAWIWCYAISLCLYSHLNQNFFLV